MFSTCLGYGADYCFDHTSTSFAFNVRKKAGLGGKIVSIFVLKDLMLGMDFVYFCSPNRIVKHHDVVGRSCCINCLNK